MPLSYYDLIIPTMISRCEILCSLMDKAAAFADSKAIPHSELINARLIEDMEPFKYQIQRVSDTYVQSSSNPLRTTLTSASAAAKAQSPAAATAASPTSPGPTTRPVFPT